MKCVFYTEISISSELSCEVSIYIHNFIKEVHLIQLFLFRSHF